MSRQVFELNPCRPGSPATRKSRANQLGGRGWDTHEVAEAESFELAKVDPEGD